jgi:hypothetical protein
MDQMIGDTRLPDGQHIGTDAGAQDVGTKSTGGHRDEHIQRSGDDELTFIHLGIFSRILDRNAYRRISMSSAQIDVHSTCSGMIEGDRQDEAPGIRHLR